MKIILPLHNARISPVFDWCMRALVIDVHGGQEVRRTEIDLSVFPGLSRVNRLVELGAGTVLCGGISLQLEGVMAVKGITVIPWICGNVEEILGEYVKQKLNAMQWRMPGVRRERYRTILHGWDSTHGKAPHYRTEPGT